MDFLVGQQVRGKVGVKVVRGIGKGGEDKHLPVAGVDRVGDLLQHVGLQVLEFGVVFGGDLVHRGQQGVDDFKIGLELVFP